MKHSEHSEQGRRFEHALDGVRVCMLAFNDMVTNSRVFKEAHALANSGAEVIVLCLWGNTLPRTERVAGFVIRRLDVHTRRLPRRVPMRSLLVLLETLVRFLWAAVLMKADIYHSDGISSLPVAYVAARLNQARAIYDSHDLTIDRSSGIGRRIQKLLILIERAFLPHVDEVIVSDGDARAQAMLDYHGIQRSYHVIRNYPTNASLPSGSNQRLRGLLSLDRDQEILLYTGHMLEGRGLDQAVEALFALPDHVVLVLLGRRNASIEERLRRKAEQHNVGHRLFVVPPVSPDEVIAYVVGARAGLVLIQNTCLSYYLSTPIKLYESIAGGTPVVASDFPEIRRVVCQNPVGPVGLTVDPASVPEIVRAVERLLQDDAFWQQCHQNALELVKCSMNWEHQAKSLISLYQGLLKPSER